MTTEESTFEGLFDQMVVSRILVRGVGWIPVKQAKIVGDSVSIIDSEFNKQIYILKSEVIGLK